MFGARFREAEELSKVDLNEETGLSPGFFARELLELGREARTPNYGL
jgi:hypothetical protein